MKMARTEELVDRDLFTCIQTYSSKNTRKIFKNIIHKDWNSVGSINQKKTISKTSSTSESMDTREANTKINRTEGYTTVVFNKSSP